MNVVLLTSDSLRHKYIATAIAEELSLQLIVSEEKSAKIQSTENLNSEDAEFISKHFKARDDSEERFFENFTEFPPDVPVLKVATGQVNDKEIRQLINEIEPDFILLFGSSIIGNEILERFPQKVINLHLGLSPYYKGSGTNLFPYHFNEPECVGATIHLATAKVDEGAVLHQLRPEIEPGDDLHSIGNKTILKAGIVFPKMVKLYSKGKISVAKQVGQGRIFKVKDLNPAILRNIYSNFENGMIKDYLDQKQEKDSEKPIIETI